jgi:hypothetical protein
LIRGQEDGLPIARRGYRVALAVESWLDHGLVGHDPNTVGTRRSLAKKHLLPDFRLAADRGGCGHRVAAAPEVTSARIRVPGVEVPRRGPCVRFTPTAAPLLQPVDNSYPARPPRGRRNPACGGKRVGALVCGGLASEPLSAAVVGLVRARHVLAEVLGLPWSVR